MCVLYMGCIQPVTAATWLDYMFEDNPHVTFLGFDFNVFKSDEIFIEAQEQCKQFIISALTSGRCKNVVFILPRGQKESEINVQSLFQFTGRTTANERTVLQSLDGILFKEVPSSSSNDQVIKLAYLALHEDQYPAAVIYPMSLGKDIAQLSNYNGHLVHDILIGARQDFKTAHFHSNPDRPNYKTLRLSTEIKIMGQRLEAKKVTLDDSWTFDDFLLQAQAPSTIAAPAEARPHRSRFSYASIWQSFERVIRPRYSSAEIWQSFERALPDEVKGRRCGLKTGRFYTAMRDYYCPPGKCGLYHGPYSDVVCPSPACPPAVDCPAVSCPAAAVEVSSPSFYSDYANYIWGAGGAVVTLAGKCIFDQVMYTRRLKSLSGRW